jgi:methylase of polypeptide subunit release factors
MKDPSGLESDSELPFVAVRDEGGDRKLRFRSEGPPPGDAVEPIGDQTPADAALRSLREGKSLIYRGYEAGLRQLYSALARRVEPSGSKRRDKARSGAAEPPLLELFHRERAARQDRQRVLSRLLVELDENHRLALERAADVSLACQAAWGTASEPYLVPFRALLGAVGAYEWQRTGIEIPALGERVHPSYGVFAPTRREYVELVAEAPPATGLSVFDIGTGTGVLALIAARSGARSVIATDIDPRAVDCARRNVTRLGLDAIVRVERADLFPGGGADRLMFNPPWLPGKPRTLLDRSIFDPGGVLLARFLREAPASLNPGGQAWLVLGDLAERIGLRRENEVEELAQSAGLRLEWVRTKPRATPLDSDEDDALAAARRSEHVVLRCFVRA